MGNSPPSKAISMPHPTRPFDPMSKRSCFTKGIIPIVTSDKAKGSMLHQLILLQDWQRVLIRAKLYPAELKQYTNFQISANETIRVLPLHLVCALDPPVIVVELLLALHVDACAMPIEPHFVWTATSSSLGVGKLYPKPTKGGNYNHQKQRGFLNVENKIPSVHPRWKNPNKTKTLSHRFNEWRKNRKGAFPVDVTYDESLCFLSKGVPSEQGEEEEAVPRRGNEHRKEVYDSSLIDHEDSLESVDSSSISTRQSFDSLESHDNVRKNVILQLSPSGGLHPLPIESDETESTSGISSRSSSHFRVHWDYEPLYEQVVRNGMLLPIHIACLYTASCSVIKCLIAEFPSGCLISVGGMIPIHLVAAGWSLPRLVPPPVVNLPIQLGNLETKNDSSTLEILRLLKSAMPDTVKVKSGNHRLTPTDYILECMDEGQYKKACLSCLAETMDTPEQPLSPIRKKCIMDDHSYSTLESFIFSSSDTSSFCHKDTFGEYPNKSSPKGDVSLSTSCISALALQRDWEGVIAAVKNDPVLASKWIYGMDQVHFSPSHSAVIWKRLPIHLACAYSAPVSVVALLLQSYPKGACLMDPHDGSLPLHIACQHSSQSSIATVKELLGTHPDAVKSVNLQGQLPLHVAMISNAPLTVIEALLNVDQLSAEIPDYHGMTPKDYADQLIGTPQCIQDLLSAVHVVHDEKSV